MKQLILYFGCLILSIQCSCCEEQYCDYSIDSGFDQTEIDSAILENLEVLGRVWGYVKYHHPIFEDSTLNIDYELFKLLPKVANVGHEIRNQILTEWIDGLGDFTQAPARYASLPSDNLGSQMIDLEWIKDTTRMGTALSNRLVQLRYANRNRNFYVTKTHYDKIYLKKYFGDTDLGTTDNLEWDCDCASFENEKKYDEVKQLDYGYRLLSVFRFWNMVEYFFPSKYLIDRPWSEVLPKYISLMATLPNKDYFCTTWRMIAEIQDSHADYSCAFLKIFGEWRIPQKTVFAEGKLIISAPDTIHHLTTESAAPFRVGDEIVLINSQPISYYLERVRNYIPCSNEARVEARTADFALRASGYTSLRIRYNRGQVQRDTMVATENLPYLICSQNNEGEACQLLNNGIWYVNPAFFQLQNEQNVVRAMTSKEGCILDLRNGMSAAFNSCFRGMKNRHCIAPDNEQCPQYYTYPQILLPGFFSSSLDACKEKRIQHKTKLIVLVNNQVQSTMETYVMWLQERRDVRVIGSQTAGANGNVSFISLPGGILTCFSGLGWFYPDGTELQRKGVKIDDLVQSTRDDIIMKRDPTLEKAIDIILKKSI